MVLNETFIKVYWIELPTRIRGFPHGILGFVNGIRIDTPDMLSHHGLPATKVVSLRETSSENVQALALRHEGIAWEHTLASHQVVMP